jgi:hypothetical protein
MHIAYVCADPPSIAARNKPTYQALVDAIHHNSRHSACLVTVNELTGDQPGVQSQCAAADVIVVQGDFNFNLLRRMQRWRADDKVLIANLDDVYHLLPTDGAPRSPVDPGDEARDPSFPAPLLLGWGLQLAHAAIACSPRLADDCSRFTRAYYVPDFVDLSQFDTIVTQTHNGIVLGWRGSRAQAHAFLDSGLPEALREICRALPSMRIALGEPEPYLFSRLSVPEQQKQFYSLDQPASTAAFWSSVDIGLWPACGAYGQRLGRLALLEYMAMRIPWLASETQAAYELRSCGRLVKNQAQDWQRAILQMAATLENQRSLAAGNPYIFALSQGLDSNIEKVLAVYDEIYCSASILA